MSLMPILSFTRLISGAYVRRGVCVQSCHVNLIHSCASRPKLKNSRLEALAGFHAAQDVTKGECSASGRWTETPVSGRAGD